MLLNKKIPLFLLVLILIAGGVFVSARTSLSRNDALPPAGSVPEPEANGSGDADDRPVSEAASLPKDIADPGQSGVSPSDLSDPGEDAAGEADETDGTKAPGSDVIPDEPPLPGSDGTSDGTSVETAAPGGDESTETPPAPPEPVPGEGIPASPHVPVTVPEDGLGDPETHTANVDLPALFFPVERTDDPGKPADGLLASLRDLDPLLLRDEGTDAVKQIVYAGGDAYETKVLPEGGTLVTMTYRFPTGQTSRRGDLLYDEKAERSRLFAAFDYLFPEQVEAVRTDFTAMRHWEEAYLRAYGLSAPDWSAFVRSRYYGTRYCRMSVTRDTVTVTVYPAGYADPLGDFAANGSYREFYTYPMN